MSATEICNVPNNLLTRIAVVEYANLVKAFDYFNQKLFKKRLPDVIFTFSHKRNSAGYFAPDKFEQRSFDEQRERIASGHSVHEIALIPEAMYCAKDMDIMATLVHELCHLWQAEYGKPSRSGYHNSEWAKMMIEVGLMPSTLGHFDCRNTFMDESKRSKEEGVKTGQKMSDYIIKDGPFHVLCQELLDSGFSLGYDSRPTMRIVAPKSKFKYTCSKCRANAWAKRDKNLVCGDCNLKMEMQEDV